MFFYTGLALLVLGGMGAMLNPDKNTWLDRWLWVPAFWFGAILLSGAMLANIIWGYWP